MLVPHLPLLCVFVLGCGASQSFVRFWHGTDRDPERPGNAHIALHCPYYVDRNLLAIPRRRSRSSNSTPTKCCPALGIKNRTKPASAVHKQNRRTDCKQQVTGNIHAADGATPMVEQLLDSLGRFRRTLAPSALAQVKMLATAFLRHAVRNDF